MSTTNHKFIDLRSDTVTQPTQEMREAMLRAEVGDDVYQEDATVNRLQELSAERMGKEAGLFVPSGTMGNLIAVLTHCGRGDEAILGDRSHTFLFEAGGIAALGGVHPHVIPNQPDGTLNINDIKGAIRGQDIHFPISKLVILENTHNRCGGVVLDPDYMSRVAELVRGFGLRLHLDGARIFNASAALGISACELTKSVDSVTFCLSKALCAPVGSVLCGTNEFISQARRIRKQLGGGMRQVGIIAAAGIVALEKMVDRLVQDHQRARILAEGLRRIPGINLDLESPATNMVFIQIDKEAFTAKQIAEKLSENAILVGVVAERRIRMVLHHDINDFDVEKTIATFGALLQG